MAEIKKPFFIVIRGNSDPSGVGQFIGAFQDQQAAEDEVDLQSQYDPATSGFYFIAEFEAQQAGNLVAMSGQLQSQIDAIQVSGQGPPGPPGPSGASFDATALSGFLQNQIDINASGIDDVENEVNVASGTLQGEIDLARFQTLMAFGSAGNPAFTSSSSSFELVTIFEYPGDLAIVNPPQNLVCFASMNQADKDGAIRIYDVTNSMVVGVTTFTGNTNIEKQSVALTNRPSGAATFEVQVRTISNGGTISLYSATLI